MQVYVHAHVCICVGWSTASATLLQEAPTLCFETGSLIILELTVALDWLNSKPRCWSKISIHGIGMTKVNFVGEKSLT